MSNWFKKKWVEFKKQHDWLSLIGFLTILLAAIGPSFIKPTNKISDSSAQNSQRSGFERIVNGSERNYKDEWNEKHSSNNHAKVDHVVRINSFGKNDGGTNYEGRTHAENR